MDGNASLPVSDCLSQSDDHSFSSAAESESDSSFYSTYDEVESITPPANIFISDNPGQPVELEARKSSKVENAASLPFVSLLNARSLYQKKDNFKKFINEFGLEIIMVSETWERENESLESLLQL